jgi:hypothetical protein
MKARCLQLLEVGLGKSAIITVDPARSNLIQPFQRHPSLSRLIAPSFSFVIRADTPLPPSPPRFRAGQTFHNRIEP